MKVTEFASIASTSANTISSTHCAAICNFKDTEEPKTCNTFAFDKDTKQCTIGTIQDGIEEDPEGIEVMWF